MLTIPGVGQARPMQIWKAGMQALYRRTVELIERHFGSNNRQHSCTEINVSMHRAYQNDFLQHAFYPGKVLYKKSLDR
jgi:hypothetical protein